MIQINLNLKIITIHILYSIHQKLLVKNNMNYTKLRNEVIITIYKIIYYLIYIHYRIQMNYIYFLLGLLKCFLGIGSSNFE
jgi:hypothetical protein